MKDENDLLSPDKSPSTLKASGVKRVNNVPLFLFFGVLAIFGVLICMVAFKRGRAQNQQYQTVKVKKGEIKKDSMSLAREVFENHQKQSEKINTEAVYTPQTPPENVTQSHNDIAFAPAPGFEVNNRNDEAMRQENERIRQDKVHQFEEAVKAKSSILVSRDKLSAETKGGNGGMTALDNDPGLAMADEAAEKFKEQLRQIEGSKKTKVMPQALGGIESEGRWTLNSTLESPKSPYQLIAGAVIPGVMVSGVRSELPGQIIGQVSQNVYDTATGSHLLIPQGTKILGLYSSDVSFGQDSVLIAWQRLTFPDGKNLDIGSMPGSDSAGYAGFRDKVNHHYMRIYGSAILMSAIVAGVSYSQNLKQDNASGNNPPSAGNVLSQSLGQQLGETTSQLVSKNLNTAPTVEISPGYRFNVTVVKDLVFKNSYQQFSY